MPNVYFYFILAVVHIQYVYIRMTLGDELLVVC
jgi:hypothetical protein